MKLIEIDGKYINPEYVAVVQSAVSWASHDYGETKTTVIMVSGYSIDVRRSPEDVTKLLGLA